MSARSSDSDDNWCHERQLCRGASVKGLQTCGTSAAARPSPPSVCEARNLRLCAECKEGRVSEPRFLSKPGTRRFRQAISYHSKCSLLPGVRGRSGNPEMVFPEPSRPGTRGGTLSFNSTHQTANEAKGAHATTRNDLFALTAETRPKAAPVAAPCGASATRRPCGQRCPLARRKTWLAPARRGSSKPSATSPSRTTPAPRSPMARRT